MYENPPSVEAAVSALGDKTRDAVLVAGGTWVMRAPLRGEKPDRTFVSLAKIPALHRLSIDAGVVTFGALVSHHDIAAATAPLPEMAALYHAAGKSANPAIRHAATVGGNLCTRGFFAPDLVPALMALGATVQVHSGLGPETLCVEDYIAHRAQRRSDEILTAVCIPRQPGKSAHARGLKRQAGEYAVANASVYLELDQDGAIAAVRVAVGAVEMRPKRWHSFETAVQGRPFASETAVQGRPFARTPIVELARDCIAEFDPRDGVDAPGWYRVRILPQLVEQAFADLADQIERTG